jgi:hypothetical protein
MSDSGIATVEIPPTRFGELQADETWYSMHRHKRVWKGAQIKLRVHIEVAPARTYDKTTPGITIIEKKEERKGKKGFFLGLFIFRSVEEAMLPLAMELLALPFVRNSRSIIRQI